MIYLFQNSACLCVFLNLCKHTDEVLVKFYFSLKAETLQNVKSTNGLLVLRKSRKFQPIALIQYFFFMLS